MVYIQMQWEVLFFCIDKDIKEIFFKEYKNKNMYFSITDNYLLASEYKSAFTHIYNLNTKQKIIEIDDCSFSGLEKDLVKKYKVCDSKVKYEIIEIKDDKLVVIKPKNDFRRIDYYVLNNNNEYIVTFDGEGFVLYKNNIILDSDIYSETLFKFEGNVYYNKEEGIFKSESKSYALEDEGVVDRVINEFALVTGIEGNYIYDLKLNKRLKLNMNDSEYITDIVLIDNKVYAFNYDEIYLIK